MTRPTLAAACAILLLASLPAEALNTRTWISGKGVDQAGCGPIANPCRSLQYAHDNTSAGGEVDVLDPAGYGAVTITKGISIINDGAGVAGALAGVAGNAITVDAGSGDAVVLRGLTIEGAGGGANGIFLKSAGTLDVSNCVVQGFVGSSSGGTDGNGILMQPTSASSVSIVNTTVSQNQQAGVSLHLTGGTVPVKLVIDRVTALGGNTPIGLFSNSSGAITATITNTFAAYGKNYGFYLAGALIKVTLDSSIATTNGIDGIVVSLANLTVGRTVSTNNANYGLNFPNSGSGGSVFSFKDNHFGGNGVGRTSGTINAVPLD